MIRLCMSLMPVSYRSYPIGINLIDCRCSRLCLRICFVHIEKFSHKENVILHKNQSTNKILTRAIIGVASRFENEAEVV